jgi:hypothetical protein
VEYTQSYHAVMMAEVVDDAKKTACEVAEVGFDDRKPPPDASYELPDGTVITVGAARQLVPEIHFRHDVMEKFGGLLKARVSTAWHAHNASLALLRATVPLRNPAGEPTGASIQLPLTLQGMLTASLSQCHAEVRRDLCHHSECAHPAPSPSPPQPPTAPGKPAGPPRRAHRLRAPFPPFFPSPTPTPQSSLPAAGLSSAACRSG